MHKALFLGVGGETMKKIALKVKGMHCTSCEMLIKDMLEEMPGISKTEASEKKKEVALSYDEKIISLQQIKTIITKAGYEAE